MSEIEETIETEQEDAPVKKTRMGKLKKKQAHREAGWGGERRNAGRKPKGDKARVLVAFKVTEEAKAQKAYLQERGVDVAILIEKAIGNTARLLGWSE